ncbi:MAG: hypothetical protein HZY76_02890 [Anaerolineae bacterium]|nr:MAG: hypothetical protein HZY76_02890 [Anaerolineae bacterium]
MVFETMHDILLCAEFNEIFFHDDPSELPVGATTALLRDGFEGAIPHAGCCSTCRPATC